MKTVKFLEKENCDINKLITICNLLKSQRGIFNLHPDYILLYYDYLHYKVGRVTCKKCLFSISHYINNGYNNKQAHKKLKEHKQERKEMFDCEYKKLSIIPNGLVISSEIELQKIIDITESILL